ncbi:hypothetical protein [Chryseobacterium sp.]|uniref:hypothetical protein n=1 Tax=Chryseobacterium sp. TaxID=1871047 RepID=UPI00388F2908
MRKAITIILVACSIFPNLLNAQGKNIGINTSTPDTSAILQVSSNSIPDLSSASKKGFLPPRVALLSNIDVSTIPSPAVGLLVYNTANNGSYPNEVSSNGYYFWDGNKWEKLMNSAAIEEAVKPRIFYVENNDRQNFTSAEINAVSPAIPNDNVVKFGTPIINTNNFITIDTVNSTFKATISGIYEFSAFVNYNPMAGVVSGNANNRAFLNLKIQRSTDGGTTWVNTIGSRTGWGVNGSSLLKTAILLGTPLKLNMNDMIRVVIANPFSSAANNNHCSGGNSYIDNDATNNIPVAKGLRIQLLDYNIK